MILMSAEKLHWAGMRRPPASKRKAPCRSAKFERRRSVVNRAMVCVLLCQWRVPQGRCPGAQRVSGRGSLALNHLGLLAQAGSGQVAAHWSLVAGHWALPKDQRTLWLPSLVLSSAKKTDGR